MSREKDNYYWLLGLSPDTATQADIKASFRKLAVKWHPDANDGDENATEMFRRINEAYSTLSDPDKKAEYDKSLGVHAGPVYAPFYMGSSSPKSPLKDWDGEDVNMFVSLEFEESLTGVKGLVFEYRREQDCPKCGGFGSLDGKAGVETCKTCGGNGERTALGSFGKMVSVRNETCPDCKGRGYVVSSPCPLCDGLGRILVDQKSEVDIPPGVDTGTILRVVNLGHCGHLDGKNGDLRVQVSDIEASPVFRREGRNLYTTVKVPPETLILGGEISVPLPLGGFQNENIPPCVKSGWSFIVQGNHGVPHIGKDSARGNLIAVLEAEWPERLTESQRKALEQYASVPKTEDAETA